MVDAIISNLNASVKNYYGKDSSFTAYSLKEFTVNDTVNFFNQMGVFPKEENEGKLYPFSEQASAISDALRNEIARLGIEIKQVSMLPIFQEIRSLLKLYQKMEKL